SAPAPAKAGRQRSSSRRARVETSRAALRPCPCRSRGPASARDAPVSSVPRHRPRPTPPAVPAHPETPPPRRASLSAAGARPGTLSPASALDQSLLVKHLDDAVRGAVDTAGGVDVDPLNLGVLREPRELPLGVADRIADHEAQRLLLIELPAQHGEELSVADPVHGRRRCIVSRRA